MKISLPFMLLLLFLFWNVELALGQQSYSEEYLQSKTTYFEVKQGKIERAGTKALKAILEDHQFFAFGEQHNSKETSLLFEALAPLFAEFGYQHMAIEVGPHTGKILSEILSGDTEVQEEIDGMIREYKLTDDQYDYPIPFFTGLEDYKMLEAFSKNGIQLWGIDQEFYTSNRMHLDRITELLSNHSEIDMIRQHKERAEEAFEKRLVENFESKEEINVLGEMLTNKEIQAFFKATGGKREEVDQIIEDLKLSWDIYSRYREGSHADRVSYMRNNFVRNYGQLSDRKAKVVLKFGGAHTSKNVSNGTYDLGALAEELAQKNESKAANVITYQRFFVRNEEEFDLSEDPGYHRIKEFIALGKRDQWALVNMESIRSDFEAGELTLPADGSYHAIRQLFSDYDYLFIPPSDEVVTKTFDK